jgi:hypothetical protein
MDMTIFTVPRPFIGHFKVIQQNAIMSWTKLSPKPHILVMGNDEGTEEFVKGMDVAYCPKVIRNELGTPTIDFLFHRAKELSPHNILAYVNADIILFDDFMAATERVAAKFEEFLIIGQRGDYVLKDPIDFSNPNWRDALKDKGGLHGVCGIDYFIFTRNLYDVIPPFAIGRTAWDNWLVWNPISREKPVVDATGAIKIIHQNHEYPGPCDPFTGPEAMENRRLAGADAGTGCFGYTSHAPWIINSEEIKRRN